MKENSEIKKMLKNVEQILLDNPYSEVTITRTDKQIVVNVSKKDRLKVQIE